MLLLDELLTLSSDAECGSLVKMLVAAIAGSNHAPEAQTSIVTEVPYFFVLQPALVVSRTSSRAENLSPAMGEEFSRNRVWN